MTPDEIERLAKKIADHSELKYCRFNVLRDQFGISKSYQDKLIESGKWLEGKHFVKREGSNSRFFIKKAINEWVEGQ